ncbi:hypothetical protein [uncultured Roseobacter sp.]|uniref:hypothetical protein n=1 Tax=uncultured Roseobacter sp. TaxID=114847 RepID=UPI00262697F5|nr:hypothetical protein [uncultured Roseobacter sp.]
MTELAPIRRGVRAHVALSTRDLHETLHHDPVLGRLTAPDITPRCYRTALQVLQRFYEVVERAHQQAGIWPDLSLQMVCAQLQADVGPPQEVETQLVYETEEALLGGLYVAHGASFGRSSFRANIAQVLPDAPQAFISARLGKQTWQSLVALMESRGCDAPAAERIERGAAQSFAFVAAVSSRMRIGS